MTKPILVHVEPNDEMLDRIEREGCIRWANGELDDITALVALARKGLKPIPADDREEVARAMFVKQFPNAPWNSAAWIKERSLCLRDADAAISTLVSLGWRKG